MMIDARCLANQLTEETVLGEWFQPMARALDKVRFSNKKFASLPMSAFILFGCLRQLQFFSTLRETIQRLFHIDEQAVKPPVARSTLSDALSSSYRCNILSSALSQLIQQAQEALPDKLAGIEGLGDRAIIATNATYQKESSHFYPIYPSQGGTDNKKGHQHLTHFDMRTGIPLASLIETQSIAEIRLLKEGSRHAESSCMNIKSAIHVVDRAFIDAGYWDRQKSRRKSTLITRMKSNLNYMLNEQLLVKKSEGNQGVIADHTITLESSRQPWRLIEFIAPDSEQYQYLTNDSDLEPGVIAFLYHRRWDLEKYFDNFKNDMANAKAWGKSRKSIAQQGMLAMASYILMRLFIERKSEQLSMTQGDTTQKNKHNIKQENYIRNKTGIVSRFLYVTVQGDTTDVALHKKLFSEEKFPTPI